jgi:hypothetical protein
MQKQQAIKQMEVLDIYKPYIKAFKDKGVITLFENYGGFYIDEPELLAKIKEFEQEYDAIVYAVTHEFTEFGELYDFLYVSKYEEEWEMMFEELKLGYACAYVWNKTDDWCSEFGSIAVRSFGGGIKRIG